MYLFVSVLDRKAYYQDGPVAHCRIKARLEAASGERCLIVPFQEFGLETVKSFRPTAVVMSGFGGRWEDYAASDFRGMADVITQGGQLPILCICGSHQLLGFVMNGEWKEKRRLCDQPMRVMRSGDPMPRQPGGGRPGRPPAVPLFCGHGLFRNRAGAVRSVVPGASSPHDHALFSLLRGQAVATGFHSACAQFALRDRGDAAPDASALRRSVSSRVLRVTVFPRTDAAEKLCRAGPPLFG